MPVDIRYIGGGLGFEVIASGVVTGDELVAVADEMYREENVNRIEYVLVDFSDIDKFDVTPEDAKIIAARDKAASRVNPNIVFALVAGKDLEFGMSRMWEALVAGEILKSRTFRDRKSAEEWLESSVGKL